MKEYFYERQVEFLYRIKILHKYLYIFCIYYYFRINDVVPKLVYIFQLLTGSNSCHDRKLWIQISVSTTRQPMLNSRNGSNSRMKFEGGTPSCTIVQFHDESR